MHPHPEPGSFFDWLRREVEVHKWILSEQAQRDLGRDAIEDWFIKYFHEFARDRLFDHISGACCFEEVFGSNAFNIAKNYPFRKPDLAGDILEDLRLKKQNLEILFSLKLEEEEVLDDVLQFLTLVNVNCCHDLDKKFKPAILRCLCLAN